jgi:hypothetical protein
MTWNPLGTHTIVGVAITIRIANTRMCENPPVVHFME